MNPRRLVLASGNAKKLRELTELATPLGYQVVAVGELAPGFDVEETGTTFEENALLKARAAAEATGELAIADDSGLLVDALDGAPGVWSARYAPTDEQRIQRVLSELAGACDRSARFACALAACTPEGRSEVLIEYAEGSLLEVPRGTNGFGYDPLFLPSGGARTFAELSAQEKHALSHRGKALRRLPELLARLFTDR
jgi:XTP/dITP diphosphohydrolase